MVVSLLMFAFAVPSSASAGIAANERPSKALGKKVCPADTLNTTLPLPAKGMASTRTITFDENCKSIIGPVEIVPADQIFTPSQGTIASVDFPVLSDP